MRKSLAALVTIVVLSVPVFAGDIEIPGRNGDIEIPVSLALDALNIVLKL